jgi:hypothetical protein
MDIGVYFRRSILPIGAKMKLMHRLVDTLRDDCYSKLFPDPFKSSLISLNVGGKVGDRVMSDITKYLKYLIMVALPGVYK